MKSKTSERSKAKHTAEIASGCDVDCVVRQRQQVTSSDCDDDGDSDCGDACRLLFTLCQLSMRRETDV